MDSPRPKLVAELRTVPLMATWGNVPVEGNAGSDARSWKPWGWQRAQSGQAWLVTSKIH